MWRSRERHGSLEERLHANKDDQVDLLLASTRSSVMIALPRLAAPPVTQEGCDGGPHGGHSPVNSCLTTSINSPFGKVAVFLSTLLTKSRLLLFFFVFGAKAW